MTVARAPKTAPRPAQPGAAAAVASPLPRDFDAQAFLQEIDRVRAELDAACGREDLRHLRRVEAVARVASALGWLAAFAGWWLPGAVGIALGRFVRWTCIAHHVLHRGYDAVPGAPLSRTSKGFALGWRRFVDWPDWQVPEAWCREHNQLHHFRLGEPEDPDLVELNAATLRPPGIPLAMRMVLIAGLTMSWRWLYFAPAAVRELQALRNDRAVAAPAAAARAAATGLTDTEAVLHEVRMDAAMLLPWGRGGEVWRRSWLPFLAWSFALPLAIAWAIGDLEWAWLAEDVVGSVALATLLGEVLVNIHSFAVIVPNHAGSDLYRFDVRPKGRAELALRQIAGSVDFRTGGFWNDLLHGYLNYQIEHHVWPDLSMRQLALAQPKLRALCQRFGVPYVQEPVLLRVQRLLRIMLGLDTMLRVERLLPTAPAAPSVPELRS